MSYHYQYIFQLVTREGRAQIEERKKWILWGGHQWGFRFLMEEGRLWQCCVGKTRASLGRFFWPFPRWLIGKGLGSAFIFLEVYYYYSNFKQGHEPLVARRDLRVHGGKGEKAGFGKKRERNQLLLLEGAGGNKSFAAWIKKSQTCFM